MRFEIKTDPQRISESYPITLLISSIIFFAIILSNISLNLRTISKFYEINYLCNLFLVEKSNFNFKRLSKITNESNKSKMWELCKQVTQNN